MDDKFNIGRSAGVVAILVIISTACSHNQYAASNKRYKKQAREFAAVLGQYPLNDSISNTTPWIGTTNFNLRKPNFVIIHHTAQNSCVQTLMTFTTEKTKVSAHYVICKDGTVHHLLNDYMRAWHAGVSKWGNEMDINSSSLGIEIDNNGFEPFTPEQINSLLNLLAVLKKTYGIPVANFIGHSDVAPGRKVDPSNFFPWKTLADNGYGLWYDTTSTVMPCVFDTLQALRVIGYDIRHPEAAIQSFKLHFVPEDSTKVLSTPDLKILYDLSKRFE